MAPGDKGTESTGIPLSFLYEATGVITRLTAITSIHRLRKHARVKRVLFLVDTRNLGEQAEQAHLRVLQTKPFALQESSPSGFRFL